MIVTRDLVVNGDGHVTDQQAGAVLMVESISAGAVDIDFLDAGGQIRGRIKGATAGRKYRPGFTFGAYIVTGAAGEVVRVIVGDGDADSWLSAMTVTISNATLNTQEQLSQALANVAPVAVGAVATVLLAADAARRGFWLRNVGAESVALGAAGLAFADAAIIVLPSEERVIESAPGAAWYARCDAGLASTINLLKW